jgi:hypothetical protein
MSELSQNPDFVEALYKRLGRDPKAGGILGPEEIKRLRELILGKNFEALDRFPGMTVPGMGRAVRLAAAAIDHSADEAIPQPEVIEATTRTAIEEELGIPAAGEPPAPDAYLRSLVHAAGEDNLIVRRQADGRSSSIGMALPLCD